jgi:hypothetical protein
MKKAGFAPAFLFALAAMIVPSPAISRALQRIFLTRFLHANRSPLRLKTLCPQQSVDGLNGTLEIPARSSYVPSLAPGVGSPATCGRSAPQCGAINVLGMPTWMK